MRNARQISTRIAATVAAGGLILAGCGGESDPEPNAAPVATQTPTSDQTPDPEPPPQQTETETVTETATETETEAAPPPEQTEAPEEPTEADPGDDGDDPLSAVHSHALDYGNALSSQDWETAYSMLSEQSIALLELDGPQDLGDEPWVPDVVENLAGHTPVVHSWVAWPETYSHEHAVALTATADGHDYAHAFGVRQVEGEWVIDQSRTDVSTGGTWVEFVNPTWDGEVDPAVQIEFRVDATTGVPVAVTLHTEDGEEPTPTEPLEDGDTVLHSAQETPQGHELLVVSGAIVDNPMVRVHAVAFG